MTDWDEFEWVVWRINVDDPEQRAGQDPDLAERTSKDAFPSRTGW